MRIAHACNSRMIPYDVIKLTVVIYHGDKSSTVKREVAVDIVGTEAMASPRTRQVIGELRRKHDNNVRGEIDCVCGAGFLRRVL